MNIELSSKNGISMSQAQSISNICHQKVLDIDVILKSYNNAEKTLIDLNGKEHIMQESNPVPLNVGELIQRKGQLLVAQAYLMEAMKAKNAKITEIRNRKFEPTVKEFEIIPYPQGPERVVEIGLDWAKSQLSSKEYFEYLEMQQMSTAIGDFIDDSRSTGKLAQLRAEFKDVKLVEFVELIAGQKSIVKVKMSNSRENLNEIHEKLSKTRQAYNNRVNYYMAKMNNMVTEENIRREKEYKEKIIHYGQERSRIAQENANLRAEYDLAVQRQYADFKAAQDTSEVAALRIVIPETIQGIVDEFIIKKKQGSDE